MNDPHVSEDGPASGSPEEMRSALFAQMVMQQSSMAMMLLGKTAHPETGQIVRDLEAARLFIDQLEMLEFKTKGNLTPEEAALLEAELDVAADGLCGSRGLPARRRLNLGPSPGSPPPSRPRLPAPAKAAPAAAATRAEDEPRKKFTKKY